MNETLHSLYSSKWETLNQNLQEFHADGSQKIKPTNPLLLKIDNEEEYAQADIRVMIFGQETNVWYLEKPATTGAL